jgi:2-(1,2-epoxy-1,2-dihydrophenyl)acetyl-CoA isomerase
MAGGDIAFFNDLLDRGGDIGEQVKPLFDDVHGIILTLRSMPQPVIAAVQGACAGFGVSLMCACDLAVAAEGSVFTLAYCHLGVSPDGGSTWVLPRMIGMKRAAELVLLGDRFDAAKALEIGLINQSVGPDIFDSTVESLAARLAAGPAKAHARGKLLLQQSLQTGLEDQLHDEKLSFLGCTGEPAFEEGVRAFMQKRKPDFSDK